VAFFATVFLVFVDLALRSTPPAAPAGPSRFAWWLVALALLFLMNAQILGRILQSRAPRTLPFRWRIGTAVASGVPFLGLYAFAAAARRMSGPGKSQEEPLALGAPGGSQTSHSRSLDDRWTRVVVREWSAMSYFVSNLVVLLWIFSALPGRTWGTIGVSVLLHAAAASGLVLHVLAGARTTRAIQVPPSNLLVPASLTLFTVPFVPFLGFVLYAFAIPRLAERTLPRALLESRAAPTREKGRELTDTNRSLLGTYALKSASLIADGAALSWLAYRAAEELTSQRGAIWAVIDWVFGVGLALGGVGLLLMLIRTLQRWIRIKSLLGFLDRNPAHRYLAASQLALVMGLYLGYQLFAGDGRKVGELVALAALCGTAVSFPRIFLSAPGEADRTVARAGWTVFFAAFAISGFGWANGHESTETMLWLFGICTALFPFAVPLFIRRQLLVRLLAPFGPGDMRDLAWSRPLRRSLRFLTVTALLPFGGLAVPAWIWIRYRYWPDFEREWQERVSRSSAGRREDR
jgi:FtsH-binding integral membrane protein